MIQSEEIKQKAQEQGVNITDIEKDYVNGWLLRTIFNESPLGEKLVLKGGNAIRKGYLPHSRFSKDLDFSTDKEIDSGYLYGELNTICSKVQEKTGVKFDYSRTMVGPKKVPIPGTNILEAKAYFEGFYGEESIDIKAQMDVTQFDKPILLIQTKNLLHDYSDINDCQGVIKCQKLEEILASKLNTLLQRRRACDLFDLIYSTFIAQDYPVNRLEVIKTFLKKTVVYESNPDEARRQFDGIPLSDYQPIWQTIISPLTSVIPFSVAESRFGELIEAFFSLLPKISVMPSYARVNIGGSYFRGNSSGYSIASEFRNSILEAGHRNRIIELIYDGFRRLVEPYAFEYRHRESDGRGVEYFWGYNLEGGKTGRPGIRRFICDKIQGVDTTSETYIPRWPVEL